MAKEGSRLPRSRFMWSFAAAFCLLCRAQSKQLSVSCIVEESSACMARSLKRERKPLYLHDANSGHSPLR